jgi:hypothetical protein
MASQTRLTSGAADRTHHVEDILPDRSVAGLVLIVIGLIIVISRLVPGTGEYVLLAIGVTCLIAFALTREYGWAVAAGLIGGLGVGVVLSTLFTDPSDGMVFMLSLAGGFAAVWLLGFAADPAERNPWATDPCRHPGRCRRFDRHRYAWSDRLADHRRRGRARARGPARLPRGPSRIGLGVTTAQRRPARYSRRAGVLLGTLALAITVVSQVAAAVPHSDNDL